jgi:hypothetical protein
MDIVSSASIFDRCKVIEKTNRKVNPTFERATLMSERTGVEVKLLLRLIKIFGAKNIFSMEGWMSDCRIEQTRFPYLMAVMKNRFTKEYEDYKQANRKVPRLSKKNGRPDQAQAVQSSE